MSKTPDIISTLQEAIREDDENESAKLIAFYEDSNEAKKEVINDVFIYICGWGIDSLIQKAHERGNFIDED